MEMQTTGVIGAGDARGGVLTLSSRQILVGYEFSKGSSSSSMSFPRPIPLNQPPVAHPNPAFGNCNHQP